MKNPFWGLLLFLFLTPSLAFSSSSKTDIAYRIYGIISDSTRQTCSVVRVPILMYHHVRNYKENEELAVKNLSVSLKDFKDQSDWLKQNGYATIGFEEFVNGSYPKKSIILTFDDGYADNYDAYQLLINNHQKAVFYVITNLLNNKNYLSASEIKEMSRNGMEFGSHSVHHYDIKIENSATMLSEVNKSKNSLEELTNSPVFSFSYPSGSFSVEAIEALKNNDYKAAVINTGNVEKLDYFTLPRIRINPGDNGQILAEKLKIL